MTKESTLMKCRCTHEQYLSAYSMMVKLGQITYKENEFELGGVSLEEYPTADYIVADFEVIGMAATCDAAEYAKMSGTMCTYREFEERALSEIAKAVVEQGDAAEATVKRILNCPFCGGRPFYPTRIKKRKMTTACANKSCKIFNIPISMEEWNSRKYELHMSIWIGELEKSLRILEEKYKMALSSMPIKE